MKLLNTARDIIASAAKRIGWTTAYHVAYSFPVSNGHATADMTVRIKPWLREGEGFKELRSFLHDESKQSGATAPPNITSITRIGS